MKLTRRRFVHLAAGAAWLPALPRPARAQAFPTRPITVIVFVGAGGTPDIIARVIGQALTQRLGQSVVVDNRPGGGGNVASPVNVGRDIVPIASTNYDSFVMLVHPSFSAKTVPEFIAHAKANPGKVNLGSSGTANLSHLSAELFRMKTGIEWVHVPFRGTPASHTALIAGDVQVMFDAVGSALPQIQSGKLHAVGVSATTRMKVLPDVPSIAEFVPGYEVTGWLGYGAPKGTPTEIVEKLHREINAVLADPAINARLLELGSIPLATSTADFAKLIADETDKWGKVVKFAGLRAD